MTDSENDPFANLYAEFIDRRRRGEITNLDAYLAQCPAEFRDELKRAISFAEKIGIRAPDDSLLKPKSRFGEFEILREIGRGGMGVVYEAKQLSLNRNVALKLIAPWMVRDDRALGRLQREAQAIAKLRHPNIVSVFATGEEDGIRYIAMELLSGKGLDELLREAVQSGERIPIPTLLRWIADIALALDLAHEKGLIHRDVKPSNIRITDGGKAVLLDFGLAADAQASASFTRTGEFQGSPYYCSPEQVASKRVTIDIRTDIYSLGVTLYEAVTGKLPFEGDTTEQIFNQILVKEPPAPRKLNPTISQDLETVIQTAMDKDRENRYPTAKDLAEDLIALLELRPIKARPVGLIGLFQRWLARNQLLAAVLASFAVILSAVFILSVTLAHKTDQALAAEQTILNKNRGHRFLVESRNLLEQDPNLALLLAIEGEKLIPGLESNNALIAALRLLPKNLPISAHNQKIEAAILSQDGSKVLTLTGAKKACVWNASNGEELFELQQDDKTINAANFDDSGKVIVTVSDNSNCQVWDGLNGSLISRIKTNLDEISQAWINSLGNRVIMRSKHRLSLWSATSGKNIPIALEEKSETTDFHGFSPNGKLFVGSQYLSGRVLVFSSETGQKLSEHSAKEPRKVSFTPDGSNIIVTASGSDGGYVSTIEQQPGRIQNLPPGTGSSFLLSTSQIHPHTPKLLCLPGGRGPAGWWMNPSFSKTVKIVDLESGLEEFLVSGFADSPIDAAVGPDNVLFREGKIRLSTWDLRSKRRLDSWVLSGDETLLGISNSEIGPQALLINRFDSYVYLRKGSLLGSIGIPGGSINAIELLNDGGIGFALTSSNAIGIRPSASTTNSTVIDEPTGILKTKLSKNRDNMLVVNREGEAAVWGLLSREPKKIFLKAFGSPLQDADLSSDGLTVALVSTSHRVFVYRVSDGEKLLELQSPDEQFVRYSQFSNDGKRLLVVMATKCSIVDIRSNKELFSLPTHSLSAHWSPDDQFICTTVWQHGSAAIWDANSGKKLVDLDPSVVSAKFSNDGSILASWSSHIDPVGGQTFQKDDPSIVVWDYRRGLKKNVLVGHTKKILSLSFDPEGIYLATTSLDNTARLWDLKMGQEILTLLNPSDHYNCVTFSSNSEWIHTGSDSGFFQSWPIFVGEYARSKTIRLFTPDEMDRFEIGTDKERATYRKDWEAKHPASTK